MALKVINSISKFQLTS